MNPLEVAKELLELARYVRRANSSQQKLDAKLLRERHDSIISSAKELHRVAKFAWVSLEDRGSFELVDLRALKDVRFEGAAARHDLMGMIKAARAYDLPEHVYLKHAAAIFFNEGVGPDSRAGEVVSVIRLAMKSGDFEQAKIDLENCLDEIEINTLRASRAFGELIERRTGAQQ